METRLVVEAAYGRICALGRVNVKRCLARRRQSNCVVGVVARIENLELENDAAVKRHGQLPGANLAVLLPSSFRC
jgi:hypothetical protein